MAASEPSQPEGFNDIGGTATVNGAPYDLVFFQHYGVNPFIDTEDDELCTYAIDVDTLSYTVTRKFPDDGFLPDQNSVRVEFNPKTVSRYRLLGYENRDVAEKTSATTRWTRAKSARNTA